MPYCYIIHSDQINRFYTGICQDNPEERIHKHDNKKYGSHRFTATATDWKLYVVIACESMAHARRIELHIKKMKSSTYIRNLKKHPEIIRRIKTKYKRKS